MKGCYKESENLTEADLPPLLARIDELWDAEKGTLEYAELDRLGTLVDEAENRLYPLRETSAVKHQNVLFLHSMKKEP
jgi:hypothetical protein